MQVKAKPLDEARDLDIPAGYEVGWVSCRCSFLQERFSCGLEAGAQGAVCGLAVCCPGGAGGDVEAAPITTDLQRVRGSRALENEHLSLGSDQAAHKS